MKKTFRLLTKKIRSDRFISDVGYFNLLFGLPTVGCFCLPLLFIGLFTALTGITDSDLLASLGYVLPVIGACVYIAICIFGVIYGIAKREKSGAVRCIVFSCIGPFLTLFFVAVLGFLSTIG